MRRHILVTNDFPPKLGGIQSYLWELWRRLPPGDFSVHTTPYRGDDEFDAAQDFDVTRSREPVLLPYPWLPGRVDRLSEETCAELVIWDPALPVGLSAPSTGRPYAVVLHGAEVTIPGRLPFTRALLGKVLRGASLVICAGLYAAAEAERAARSSLPTLIVPPGVDTERFSPLDRAERDSVRTELGLPTDAPVVVGVSRLVPRKGMDVLIRAAGLLRSRFPTWSSPLPEQAVTTDVSPASSNTPQHRSACWVGCRTACCPVCTELETCSPCHAGPGGAASNRRASESCSWRQLPAEYPRLPETAVVPPRPSNTV